MDIIDELSGWIVHVLSYGCVDEPRVDGHETSHDGFVCLRYLAILELPTQFTMRVGIASHHDHARGIAIKSVDDPGSWKSGIRTGRQAVGLFRPDAGHRKES